MTHCLPGDWPVEITYASNGKEGLEHIKAGRGEVVFLDLNMPEMDGFEVLQQIRDAQLETLPIVVSGDVQTEAFTKAKKLGALDFIKKPVSPEAINKILKNYGIHQSQTGEHRVELDGEEEVTQDEAYQELANVGLGRAVKLLAHYLGTFVDMSVPLAVHMTLAELQVHLHHVHVNEKVSAVSQGFVGGGVTGEALLMFNDSNIQNIAKLLQFDGDLTDETQLELLMDISNILIGACLAGLSDQLELRLSQGHPQVLNQHGYVSDVLKDRGLKPALTLELGCSIQDHSIDIELLLLFTDESIEILNDRLNLLVS